MGSSRMMCSKAYVRYAFFGEVYEAPVINTASCQFNFEYSHVHHIESVTQEFLDFLAKPMPFHVHTAPYILLRKGMQPSTSDPVVVSRMMGRGKEMPPLDNMDKKTIRLHAANMKKSLANMEDS